MVCKNKPLISSSRTIGWRFVRVCGRFAEHDSQKSVKPESDKIVTFLQIVLHFTGSTPSHLYLWPVIPAKAGIQILQKWIPRQVRNDNLQMRLLQSSSAMMRLPRPPRRARNDTRISRIVIARSPPHGAEGVGTTKQSHYPIVVKIMKRGGSCRLAIIRIEDKMYSPVWIVSKPQSRKGRLTYGRVGKHGF